MDTNNNYNQQPQGYPPAQPQQQPPQQQPPQHYAPAPEYPQQGYITPPLSGTYPGKGLSVASMVLGICSIVFAFIFIPVSVIAGIAGIILGAVAMPKAKTYGAPTGMATAGIACGITGLAITLMFAVACYACVSAFGYGLW